MAKQKRSNDISAKKIKPALTPEAEENQMIALAVDLAKQQLLDGTASSQVITHFLKLGSSKEKLEAEKMKKENELMQAKKENLQAAKHTEELYQNALDAMRRYSGNSNNNND